MMQVEAVAAALEDRAQLWAELQDYIAEMTAYVDIAPVNGTFEYPGFDAYWTDENRWPFWAVVDGVRAGFALLRREADGTMVMAEFHTQPRCRRTGVGLRFARQLLARFPATWILSEFAANSGAVAFWHRAIEGYAYTERNYVGGMGKERVEQRVVVA
jgi:predicted acetyltransferase